ncbi:uncharacterized protein LOC113474094 [Ciona intestinalis]
MNFLSASPLQHLNLSHNQISCVQEHTFDDMKYLKILELGHNNIPDFGSCLFKNLTEIMHIDLSHNEMTELKRLAFSDLPNVKRIRLHNQMIACIDTHAFVDVPRIGEIYISSNRLPTFPHATFEYRNWPSLYSIHADNNLIQSIEEYPEVSFKGRDWERYCPGRQSFIPFRSLGRIGHLKLNHNSISSVDAETFCQMPLLRHLTLHYNLLTTTSLHKDVFLCTQQIHFLQLSGNLFRSVPPAVIGKERLPVVNELALSSNQIGYVERGDLTGSEKMTELWLAHNRIVTIEDDALPKSLVRMSLNNNVFFNFKHNNPFLNMTKLRDLYIGRNAIDRIPRGAFCGLESLQELHMQNNKIGLILNDTFKDSPMILELYLNSNQITTIEDGALDHLNKNFRYFRLQNNWLSDLPNPTFNDFSGYTTGDTINMENNRIEHVGSYQFSNLNIGDHLYLHTNRITTVESFGFKTIRTGRKFDWKELYIIVVVISMHVFLAATIVGVCVLGQDT